MHARVASETAVWYSTDLFAVALRWELVRDPEGKFKPRHSFVPTSKSIVRGYSAGLLCAGS